MQKVLSLATWIYPIDARRELGGTHLPYWLQCRVLAAESWNGECNAVAFTTEELPGRRARTCSEMVQRGLDAMLLFRQESMYYLTGYDTFGYVYFQCLVLTADGRMVLLTRAPDLRQARCSRRMR